MPIVHFDRRQSVRTPDAQRVSGRGFALYQKAPGDPERLLHIQEWTDEVDALYASDGPARVALKGERVGDLLRHLARYAGCVRSLSIESESRIDGAPLEAFTSLARLALTCAVDNVPFGKLVALRACEINSPMTLDALAEAPWLEDLGLERLKLRDMEALTPLRELRRLRLTQLKSLETLAGLERLPLEELHLIQVSRVASLAPLSTLPLRMLEIVGSRGAAHLDAIGEIEGLESLKIDSGPSPESFTFLGRMARLECLHFINTPVRGAASLAPMSALVGLRDVMIGGDKPLGMKDLEILGQLLELESVDLSQGPKEMASIAFLRRLRRLREFRLSGTVIIDGDLSVLLSLPKLEYAFISPAKRHYSYTTETLEAAMRAGSGQRQA